MEAIALILGTYAITIALTESDGPWGSLYKLRRIKWLDNFGVLNCFLCTAFWIALILSLVIGRLDLLLIAWGASTIIDKLIKLLTVKSVQ